MNILDQNELFFALAFAGVFHSLVLYVIISYATRADKRAKYDFAQMDLLGKIAKQQGVPDEEIQKTYREAGL